MAFAPWSMAACSALWLSCAESLLSNCSSCSFGAAEHAALGVDVLDGVLRVHQHQFADVGEGPESGSM